MSKELNEKIALLLREHFEGALENVKISVNPSAGIEPGFDITFDTHVVCDAIEANMRNFCERFKLTDREWGYYLSRDVRTCNGIGIKISEETFLKRLEM